MMDARRKSLVRSLLWGAFGVALAGALLLRPNFHDVRRASTSYPALQIPIGMAPLAAERLRTLHARYDAIATESGVEAMRSRIRSDIVEHASDDLWLEAIAEWIDLVAWTEAADLSIDVAERAGTLGRCNCASALSERATPLVTGAMHGRRIRNLLAAETDLTSIDYWNQVLSRCEK
jgi:hypothetical protein